MSLIPSFNSDNWFNWGLYHTQMRMGIQYCILSEWHIWEANRPEVCFGWRVKRILKLFIQAQDIFPFFKPNKKQKTKRFCLETYLSPFALNRIPTHRVMAPKCRSYFLKDQKRKTKICVSKLLGSVPSSEIVTIHSCSLQSTRFDRWENEQNTFQLIIIITC